MTKFALGSFLSTRSFTALHGVRTLSIILACAAMAAEAKGETWLGAYDPGLGTLPTSQGWTFQNGYVPTTTAPTVVNGELRQGPTQYSGTNYWHRTDILSDYATPDGFVLDMDLKIASSTYGPAYPPGSWVAGYQLELTDKNKRTVTLGISSSGVRIANDFERVEGSSPFYNFNTTTQFNNYRLTINDSGVNLKINNVAAISMPLGRPQGYANAINSVDFGDTTVGGSSQSALKTFRWGITGQGSGAGSGIRGNLLTNPGAELGNTSGWTAGGAVPPSAASVTTIPPEHDNGFTPNNGTYYFTGGRSGSGYLLQTVSLLGPNGASASLIDTGFTRMEAGLSEVSLDQGALSDVAKFTVVFFDANGTELSEFSDTVVQLSPSRPTVTPYADYTAYLDVPVGARTAEVRVDFILNSGPGSDCDVFVDDVFLRFSAIPEPGSIGILAPAGLLVMRKKRTRAS